MAACNVQDLMNEAACFNCQTPGVWQILELQLLCNILSAGGSGGGGSSQILINGTGAPPPDPTKPAISYPSGGGGISTWDVLTQAWI